MVPESTLEARVRELIDLAGCDSGIALDASPLGAVLVALREMTRVGGDGCWKLTTELDGWIENPYDAAAGQRPLYAMERLTCAIQVCGLIPISCDLIQDTGVYLDPLPDSAGAHRVYIRDESTLPGLPWSFFDGLEDAVAWMSDVTRTPDQLVIPERQLDSWEQGPTSADWVLQRIVEGLDELDLDASSTGAPAIDWTDREAGWERRLCLRLLESVAATGTIDMPPSFDRALLGRDQQRFVEYLLRKASH